MTLLVLIGSMIYMWDFEREESIPRKTVGAQELILNLLKERAETGRVYIMNIDHCNSHSSFKDKVNMSNLCQEITLPTYPINHIDDNLGEIALCILSAINVGKITAAGGDKELEELCDLSVRALDELIDYQDYPVEQLESPRRRVVLLVLGLLDLLIIWRNLVSPMTLKKQLMQSMDLLSPSSITF